jgi:hypothetical protein
MRTSRKKLAVIAGTLSVLAIAGAAFAYFTASGSGTGTATVGSSSAIQLSSDTVGDLYPGGADVAVTVDINNPGNGNQYVDDISGSVADNGDCLGSWFVVDTIDYNTNLDAGESDSSATAVRMTDTGTNQDVCQGLSMTINWSSN